MAYNSAILRSAEDALVPEDVSTEIIKAVPETSMVMRLGRRLPPMSRNQRRLPVLSALVHAYFVNGDTGMKQTSRAQWTNKYINAEEIAVVVPIPEAYLDDSAYDIWSEVRPLVVEAFAAKFDAAVMFGAEAPSDWPTNLLSGAITAGNTTTVGAIGDLYDDIMGTGGLLSEVEADGYSVTGHAAAMTMKSRLRGMRSSVYNGTTMAERGMPLFVSRVQDRTVYELDGEAVEFARGDWFDAASALMFSGDWNQLVYSIRQDITYKILTEAVIQDAAGNIVFNLAQQDMVALRAVMRLGWQLPNPVNRLAPTEATRYPFAALLP